MKIIKSIIVAALLATSLIACKKDKSVFNQSLVGIWEGKWGDVGQTPVNFIKFELKGNGTLTRLNQQGQVIANGNWKMLNSVEFECTYTHSSNGEKHNIGGLYTDFNGEIIGTWGYNNSKANGGTIELLKQ